MANWESTLEPDLLEKVRYRAIQRIRRENREVLRRPEGHRDYLQRVFREELERIRPDMSIGQLRELARGLALYVMGYRPLYAGGRGLELLRAKRPYRNWKAVE